MLVTESLCLYLFQCKESVTNISPIYIISNVRLPDSLVTAPCEIRTKWSSERRNPLYFIVIVRSKIVEFKLICQYRLIQNHFRSSSNTSRDIIYFRIHYRKYLKIELKTTISNKPSRKVFSQNPKSHFILIATYIYSCSIVAICVAFRCSNSLHLHYRHLHQWKDDSSN